MLHETRQRHAVRRRELTYGKAAAIERFDDAATGAIGQCRKNLIQRILCILNHMVQYRVVTKPMSSQEGCGRRSEIGLMFRPSYFL